MANQKTKLTRAPKRSTTKAKAAAKSTPRARRSREGRPGPVNEWVELRQSDIHGLGMFARKDIPKGTRII